MWHHARLLRRALLMTSLLTFSGLHIQQDQLPIAWRAARLLSISLVGTSFAAIVSNLFIVFNNGKALLYNMTSSATIFHSALMLVHLLRYRRQLHGLLRNLDRLETSTALFRRPRDYLFLQRHSAGLLGISVLALSCWMVGFFTTAEMKHPNYPVEWVVPKVLQSQPWYVMVLTLQVVFSIMIISVQVTFDVLLGGFIDALTLAQERLQRYSQKLLNLDDRKIFHLSNSAPHATEKATMKLSSPNFEGSEEQKSHHLDGLHKTGPLTHSITNSWNDLKPRIGRNKFDKVEPAPSLPSSGCLDAAPDLESRLAMFLETYSSLRQFSAIANDFCSIPILSLHACVTTTLLLGSYVSILMYHDNDAVSAKIYGFAIFTLAVVVRLVIVSSAGSRLMEQGQRLHLALVAVRWPSGASSGIRFQLQMILEHTRMPIAFEGWGLLTVQKGTMLSLFSFVLTYFVIMVQMKVA